MKNKDLSKLVRTHLNNAGFKGKFNLRVNDAGYNTAIEIKVKNDSDYDEIKKIALKFREVDQDEFGEILAGANTFVHVIDTSGCIRPNW